MSNYPDNFNQAAFDAYWGGVSSYGIGKHSRRTLPRVNAENLARIEDAFLSSYFTLERIAEAERVAAILEQQREEVESWAE
jgi:hypothetical protein